MLLNKINNNCHEVETDNYTVLFSYSTPVGIFVPRKGIFLTEEKFSCTTSKHVNLWRKQISPFASCTVLPKEQFSQKLEELTNATKQV